MEWLAGKRAQAQGSTEEILEKRAKYSQTESNI